MLRQRHAMYTPAPLFLSYSLHNICIVLLICSLRINCLEQGQLKHHSMLRQRNAMLSPRPRAQSHHLQSGQRQTPFGKINKNVKQRNSEIDKWQTPPRKQTANTRHLICDWQNAVICSKAPFNKMGAGGARAAWRIGSAGPRGSARAAHGV